MAEPTSQKTSNTIASGMRLAFVGILVNIVFSLVKLLAGFFGHSYALIADGIESTLDIAGSAIIWSGLKFAAKPPDDEHPYGHGKAEPIAAVIVALVVIFAALGLAVESVRAILSEPARPKVYTLAVLVVVIVVKWALSRMGDRLGEQAQSTAIKTDAMHHRSDAITSVAAFAGISITLLAGPKFAHADGWAALFACAVIAYNGVHLLTPAVQEIMDTAPAPDIERNVRKVAASVAGVIDIDQCRVRKMGLEFYVDLHVGVDGLASVRDGHQISHNVKDAVRQSNPSIADVLVHIEPVIDGRRGRATFVEAEK